MKANYRSAGKSRKIRTNNIAIFRNTLTSADIAIAELIANGVDAALANKSDKVKIVDVSFESIDGIDYVVVKNTGKPIKDIAAMLDLGHERGEAQPECGTNHLRGVGFNHALGYFSHDNTDFVIETRRKDGWHKAMGPYEEEVRFEIADTKEFLYGDRFVTRIAIRMEDKLSVEAKSKIKEALRRKFSVILMKEKSLKIFFDGEELSYVIHGENGRGNSGSIIDDKDDILNRLYVGVKDADELRKDVRLVKQGGFTFAEVDCPIINGKVHVLSMEAPKQYQGTNIMGVSVFNFGMLIEYSCGDIISKLARRAVNRMNNFHSMPNNRNEFSVLATYVDLLPGEGYLPTFDNIKKHVNWEYDDTSRKLRIFIDDLVGGYYREFIRVHQDMASRAKVDAFLENMFVDGNYAYIREGAIWEDGFKGKTSDCARLDGILLKKTPKNFERIQAYKKSAYSAGYRSTYKLTNDDFDLKMITPSEDTRTEDWTYDFKVVEYKNIKSPHLTDVDVYDARRYAEYLEDVFDLDISRISIVLVGKVDEDNQLVQRALKIARNKGKCNITITDTPVLDVD